MSMDRPNINCKIVETFKQYHEEEDSSITIFKVLIYFDELIKSAKHSAYLEGNDLRESRKWKSTA